MQIARKIASCESVFSQFVFYKPTGNLRNDKMFRFQRFSGAVFVCKQLTQLKHIKAANDIIRSLINWFNLVYKILLFSILVAKWTPRGDGSSSGGGSPLTKEEIIALIAGVGGFILIVILILFLCLIRKRQKPKRGNECLVKSQNFATLQANVFIAHLRKLYFEY